MHSRRLTIYRIFSIFVFSICAVSSQGAVSSRLGPLSDTGRIAVPHNVPARALAATDLGVAASSRQMNSLMLTFNRTGAQTSALNQLLIDLQDPSSSRYHQWLTPEQFGAQFGLSAADLAKVSGWLVSQGFTITATARGSNFIAFTGTAGQVQHAFGTNIHALLVDGDTYLSNLIDPVLPAGIAGVVTSIAGLNDFKLKSRARSRVVKLDPADTTGLHPQFTSDITGSHFIAPGDFNTIYDVKPLLASSCGANPCNGIGVGVGTGGGYSIAVAGQTDIVLADVTAFRAASGLCNTISASCPSPLPTVKLYGSDPGKSSSDLAEAMLDVEWAGAIAPNANIVYVNSTNVIDSLRDAINDNLAPIISISYGDCEVNFGGASLAFNNQIFQQANVQGQTIVGPSGDSGATDCSFNSYPAATGLGVDFPSSSPFVTSAGGTMFVEGSGSYWNANSSANVNNAASALGYIPETVWNETTSTHGIAASGGGASSYFTKPYWQIGPGVPNDFSRDVPDIALNAASGHDGTLYCVSGSCVNGTFRAADGQSLSVVGGTSVAAPTFAGLLALVEQKIGSRIGNAGPTLYALANSTYSTNVFHDVVAGTNSSPCTSGTQDCPAGGAIGYSAAPGYDRATGWGSVDAFNLANDWKLVTPAAAGTTTGQNTSVTTVSSSPATSSPICLAAAGVLSLTVTVASASASTIAPSGTVQMLVDNVPTGSPSPLSGGVATLTLSTAGIRSGGHTVSAVYSGDVSFSSSKASTSVDVVSSTLPDFAFTPCSAKATARSGGSAPGVLLTVAPVNGFTGSVTFSATATDSSLAANYTFSVTPVVLTSSASGTTVFTLTAYATNSKTINSQAKLVDATGGAAPNARWYTAGSGAMLASVLLLTLPRRRRWGALLAGVLSFGALAATGCGSGSGTLASGGGVTPTITNAVPGTYNVRLSAFATTPAGVVVHSTTVSFTVVQ